LEDIRIDVLLNLIHLDLEVGTTFKEPRTESTGECGNEHFGSAKSSEFIGEPSEYQDSAPWS
jgi:hypothetical protein